MYKFRAGMHQNCTATHKCITQMRIMTKVDNNNQSTAPFINIHEVTFIVGVFE